MAKRTNIYVSEKEHELIKEMAKRKGISISSFLKSALDEDYRTQIILERFAAKLMNALKQKEMDDAAFVAEITCLNMLDDIRPMIDEMQRQQAKNEEERGEK
ncbi:TPA: ribbon-helix-helix protein, CopG family [Bacillus nitratireducens]